MPREYRELHARGYLTLDRPAAEISATPGDGYLYLADMEWYRLEEIVDFQFPDFCTTSQLNLVPFAFTGGGDYWCWQVDTEGPRVLMCYRDDIDATIYSPNFQGALYRAALHYACHWIDDQAPTFAEARSHLRRWSSDLRVICPGDWCDTLASIAERPPTQWNMHKLVLNSLLTPQEKMKIERRDLQLPETDTTIRWMNL